MDEGREKRGRKEGRKEGRKRDDGQPKFLRRGCAPARKGKGRHVVVDSGLRNPQTVIRLFSSLSRRHLSFFGSICILLLQN